MISQQKFSFLIGCCIVGLFLNILTWLYFSMAGLSSGPAAAADGAPTLPSPVAVATETPAATASTDIAKSPPRSFSSTKWPAFSKGYERVGFIGEVWNQIFALENISRIPIATHALQGAYASVYRAKCLAGEHKGKICAIKVLNLEKQKTSVDIIAVCSTSRILFAENATWTTNLSIYSKALYMDCHSLYAFNMLLAPVWRAHTYPKLPLVMTCSGR